MAATNKFLAQSNKSCPRAQDLLLCAKNLFVAAMVAWVHPGPTANRANQKHKGAVRVRSREAFRGSKSKAPPLLAVAEFPSSFGAGLPPQASRARGSGGRADTLNVGRGKARARDNRLEIAGQARPRPGAQCAPVASAWAENARRTATLAATKKCLAQNNKKTLSGCDIRPSVGSGW